MANKFNKKTRKREKHLKRVQQLVKVHSHQNSYKLRKTYSYFLCFDGCFFALEKEKEEFRTSF